MKDKTKNIITAIVSAIEAYLIYLAQGNPEHCSENYPAPFNHGILTDIYPIVHPYLGDFVLIFIIAIVLLQLLFYFLTENDYKQWLGKLFQHIIDQSLGGQTYETRITLYVEKKGWHFFWTPLFFALARIFTEKTFRYIPGVPNPFRKCLIPYARFSYPEKEPTYTVFRAVSKEQVQCEGAVEQCYKTGKDVFISAPFINDIILPVDIKDIPNDKRQMVKDYMNKTGLSYNKLRRLQRKANVVYAIPLRRGPHIWGVLVFDNNSKDNPISLKDKLKDVIDNYQKTIQITIENI